MNAFNPFGFGLGVDAARDEPACPPVSRTNAPSDLRSYWMTYPRLSAETFVTLKPESSGWGDTWYRKRLSNACSCGVSPLGSVLAAAAEQHSTNTAAARAEK